MLYEVITMPAVQQFRMLGSGTEGCMAAISSSPSGSVRMGSSSNCQAVITSYSIHYTKLYEHQDGPVAGRVGQVLLQPGKLLVVEPLRAEEARAFPRSENPERPPQEVRRWKDILAGTRGHRNNFV